MRRVIKIGGSLLTCPDLADRVERWIFGQPPAETFAIVGGGAIVNAVRELDRVRPIDPETVHWICIELLDATYRLLAATVDWPRIDDASLLNAMVEKATAGAAPTLIAVSAFYDRHSTDEWSRRLPCDWRTTSDSLAALLACKLDADELVLLKSCPVDSNANVAELGACQIVDQALADMASGIRSVRVERLPE